VSRPLFFFLFVFLSFFFWCLQFETRTHHTASPRQTTPISLLQFKGKCAHPFPPRPVWYRAFSAPREGYNTDLESFRRPGRVSKDNRGAALHLGLGLVGGTAVSNSCGSFLRIFASSNNTQLNP